MKRLREMLNDLFDDMVLFVAVVAVVTMVVYAVVKDAS